MSIVDQIPESDNASHEPGDDERWQETTFLAWFDPVARAGGFHHVDVQPNRERACLWSWLAVDGRVVAHRQDLNLPLPKTDISELELDSLSVSTLRPLRDFGFTVELDGARAELCYTARTEPFAYHMDGSGATVATGHYETHGRVTGTVSVGERQVPVEAAGFQDHSWGPRDYGSVLAHRWLWAYLGEDLLASVFSLIGERGRADFGYVHDAGTFHAVRQARFNARIDDDGHSPIDADVRVWTATGRGYRFGFTVDVSSISSQDGDFFITDGLGVAECGSRLGPGLLEVHDAGRPTAAERRWLGLDTAGGATAG
jgi:hypothetical protein